MIGDGKVAGALDQSCAEAGKITAIPIIIAANFCITTRFIDTLTTLASPHFLTTRQHHRLIVALALSLFLHLLPVLPGLISLPAKPPTTAPLNASLRPPPAAPAEQVPLILPEQPKPLPAAAPVPKPPPQSAKTWTQAVGQQLKKLDAAGQFYPAEAIARGLEGNPVVLLVIDEAGNVVAARIEESSGHPILDAAALRAGRSLRSLPADAPRETLLPLRFRLRQ